MKAKITEIFRSVQGEGKYAGLNQVFVRFAGCPVRCAWCDTPGAVAETGPDVRELGQEEVLSEVARLGEGCRSVSLTGGEPLMQKDFLRSFLPALKKSGYQTYLDTSGVLYEALDEIMEHIDIIAMDIKLPSSTGDKPYWREHEAFLRTARTKDTFIKMVISMDTIQEDLAQAVALIEKIAPEMTVVIQPNSRELGAGVIQKCMEYQRYCLKYLRDVRIVPQMHKLVGLR